MRENSRFNRADIDNLISEKKNYISEKEKLNMTTHDEIRRLEAETQALEGQFNQNQQPQFEQNHREVDDFLNNYNSSQISS